MIPYKEIKKIVRFKLNDFNETQYSDFQIMMALNEVIRYLSISQSMNNSDFLNKGYSYDSIRDRIDYKFVGIELPSDFVALVAVRDHKGRLLEPCDASDFPKHNQYKISGERLYCGCPAFRMMYNASIPEIDKDNDKVDLPVVFKDTLVQLTTLVLQQSDTDVMHSAADIALEKLIPKRKYSHVKIKLPFKIG